MKKYAKQTAFLLWTTCLVSANISVAVASDSGVPEELALHRKGTIDLSSSRASETLVLQKSGVSSLRVFPNAAGEIRDRDGRGFQVTDAYTPGSRYDAHGGARVVFALHDPMIDSEEQQMRVFRKQQELTTGAAGLSAGEDESLASATRELLEFYATTSTRYLGIRDWVDVLTNVTDGESLKPLLEFSRVVERCTGSFDMADPINQALSAIPGLVTRIITLYNSRDFKEALREDTNHFLPNLIRISKECRAYIQATKNEGKVSLPSDSEKALLSINGVFLSDAITVSLQLGKFLDMINRGEVFKDLLSRIKGIKRYADEVDVYDRSTGALKMYPTKLQLFLRKFSAVDPLPESYDWSAKKHPIFADFLESVNGLNRLLGSIERYQANVHSIQFSRAAAARHLRIEEGSAAIEDSASSQSLVAAAASEEVVLPHHDYKMRFLSLGDAAERRLAELKRKEDQAIAVFSDTSPHSLVSFLEKDIKDMRDLLRKPIP